MYIYNLNYHIPKKKKNIKSTNQKKKKKCTIFSDKEWITYVKE